MSLLAAIPAVLAGLVLLTLAGDRLVDGAVALARHYKISQIFIGVAIIGLGTSLPEMMSTVSAARAHAPALGLGNILGSNIANIGLILAIGLLLTKGDNNIKREEMDYALMWGALALFALLFFLPAGLNWQGGMVLIMALAGALILSYRTARKKHMEDISLEALTEKNIPKMPLKKAFLLVAFGLGGLFIGADLLVNGAVSIARTAGISERIIGLTLVAIGTSLPELAATIAAARKKKLSLVMGNVIGSNMFNVLGAAGAGAFFFTLNTPEVTPDLMVAALFSAAMGLMFWLPKKHDRKLGMALLGGYIFYMIWLTFL